MRQKLLRISVLVAFVFLILGVYSWTTIGNSGDTEVREPNLASINVNGANFEIRGNSLEKVEVWRIPVGKDIPESDYVLLGEATLMNTDSIGFQTWTRVIPTKEFKASQIFARGFNKDGEKVKDVYLPVTGSANISEALWPEEKETIQIANPAATHCTEKLGGTVEIRTSTTTGSQTGYCHLPDERVCEEWALFRDGSCVE